MVCTITIARYPKYMGWAGFLSMAVFRLPLWRNPGIFFWKLMGSGRNGSFDINPDWRQWAILTVTDHTVDNNVYAGSSFISSYFRFFRCETWVIALEPIEAHGTWDGKHCFGDLPRETAYEGQVAVLTRATIRLAKLSSFWRNVPAVATRTSRAPGFMGSFGIGEIPFIKQATFSVWESKAAMKDFAYRMREHTAVIAKTRREDWYSEDMFVRFRILHTSGLLNGKNPLREKG